MNIKEITKLEKKELKQFKSNNDWHISSNAKILDGFKKDHLDSLVLSIGDHKADRKRARMYDKNAKTIPYIDIRVWTTDRHSGEKIPTKRGIRFTPAEYAMLFNLLKDNYSLISNNSADDPLTVTAGGLLQEVQEELEVIEA